MTIQGTVGVVIPVNTSFQASSQNEYVSTLESVVNTYVIQITTLTFNGATGLAKAVTSTDHGLAPGILVDISGALNPEYNVTGVNVQTVIDEVTFEYPITGTPVSPDLGVSKLVGYDAAWIEFGSVETGEDTNLDLGESLNITNPIVNLESTGYVQFGGAIGGKDVEGDDNYRERVLDAWQSWKGSFNVSFVEFITKSVSSDITRVWIFPFTIDDIASLAGTVEVYFTTDNLSNIIPSLSLVNEVKARLEEVRTVCAKVVVAAPTPQVINFTFTSITPDTSSMRQAIEDQLIAFFQDNSYVAKQTAEIIIKENAYKSAIYQTIDDETGNFLQDFTLIAPTGDITATLRGHLPVVGTVNF